MDDGRWKRKNRGNKINAKICLGGDKGEELVLIDILLTKSARQLRKVKIIFVSNYKKMQLPNLDKFR